MKASDLFVQSLEAEGVEYIFGLPGEENLDLLDSLADSDIQFIPVRHEQGAGFMAATYGRLTGEPGVCLSTLGPGATNLLTAAAYANLGAMPMLMITGQKPLHHNKQGRFQILDVVSMMEPVTKFARGLVSPGQIPASVREAFRLARTERPGACHLELPEDVARSSSEHKSMKPSSHRIPVASDQELQRAAELINSAQRAVMMIGSGANRNRVCRALGKFVDETGIYFGTTQMGKGVVSDEHPQNLGNAALSSGDFVHQALQRADLIIMVGHDVYEKPPFNMNDGDFQVLHINFGSAQVDHVYAPQSELIGDIAYSIEKLASLVDSRGSWDAAETLVKSLGRNLKEIEDRQSWPIHPARLSATMRELLPPRSRVCLDNGLYKLWFARHYSAQSSNTLLLDNALASMGAGLCSALTAKLVYPEDKVVAVCGDGGFLMNAAEMETAKRLNLHLIVVVLRDDKFGMIRWKQEQLKLENYGLEFTNPDFVKLAEAYGAQGYAPQSEDELREKFQHALEADGIHLFEVPIDYSDSLKMFKDTIPQAAEKALSTS